MRCSMRLCGGGMEELDCAQLRGALDELLERRNYCAQLVASASFQLCGSGDDRARHAACAAQSLKLRCSSAEATVEEVLCQHVLFTVCELYFRWCFVRLVETIVAGFGRIGVKVSLESHMTHVLHIYRLDCSSLA